MPSRTILLLCTAWLLACEQPSDEAQGAGGAGVSGQLSGGAGASPETGGASGAGGAGTGAAAAGGAGGMMSGGGAGGSAAGSGGGGAGGQAGTATTGGAGGEAAADAGGLGGEGGASGTGSLQEDLGPCCEAHDGPGCQDQATAECVCSVIPSCCTDRWEEACAIMVTQKHCEAGIRDCVCGDGADQWQLDSQCCMGDWSALCQSTAVQKCVAKDSCF